MSNRAFQISAVHGNGSAINGTVHVERTGRSYSFDYFSDRNDDGAPLVRLYQAGTRPRVVPLNQLRDVRNAVREHFARKPAPPAAPVASDPVPADVPCYLAVSTDGAGVETVMGVFRVAEHASADAAEMEAGKLCERIERAAPGAVCHVRANPDVNAAFADLATAEHTLRNLSADSTVWGSAFDRREAARERAVSLDPVRFVRTYPSQAYAFRHLLPADMVARIEAAEDDAELRAAVGAPAMVPQPAQQQQGRAPELTPHPIYNRTQFPYFVCHHGNWDIYANATGWCASIPMASAAADGCRASHFGDAAYVLATLGVRVMVPQPCQPQQGRAAPSGFYAFQARGERVEPARSIEPGGLQERDGITPRTIQAHTVHVRDRAEWYAFHHAVRSLARGRMLANRSGETFAPVNICGRMHKATVKRFSPIRQEPISLMASMISARPRRQLIAVELEWAARYRQNMARDVLHSGRRAMSLGAARASIAEARSLATNFNRLPE